MTVCISIATNSVYLAPRELAHVRVLLVYSVVFLLVYVRVRGMHRFFFIFACAHARCYIHVRIGRWWKYFHHHFYWNISEVSSHLTKNGFAIFCFNGMFEHTCSSRICNKYFHRVKSMTFHLQVAADIHCTADMQHAIASQQLTDKIDPGWWKAKRKKKIHHSDKLQTSVAQNPMSRIQNIAMIRRVCVGISVNLPVLVGHIRHNHRDRRLLLLMILGCFLHRSAQISFEHMFFH